MRRLVNSVFGPGATSLEVYGALAWASAVTAIFVSHPIRNDSGWTWYQLAVLAIFAFDMAGGMYVLSSRSGNRYWRDPARPPWFPYAFLAAHVHPLVMAAAFPGISWEFGFLTYLYMLAAATSVLHARRHLQRPFALVLFVFGYLALSHIFPLPDAWRWFILLYLVKLLVAFTLDEGGPGGRVA